MNKRERVSLYKRLITHFEQTPSSGICLALMIVTPNFCTPEIEELTELMTLKPKRMYKDTGYWWKPHNGRIRIRKLKQAIELCQKKKETKNFS